MQRLDALGAASLHPLENTLAEEQAALGACDLSGVAASYDVFAIRIGHDEAEYLGFILVVDDFLEHR
jgi:hypothetical protein